MLEQTDRLEKPVEAASALHGQLPAGNDDADSQSVKLRVGLSEEEKARIWAEEHYRNEIRRQFEATDSQKSFRKRIWAALNSSFALWFLSSVVLSGLTAGYAWQQNKRDEQNRNAGVERRLNTEISNRIFMAIEGLKIDERRINLGNVYAPVKIYDTVVFYLNNYHRRDQQNPNDFSVYAEYKEKNFRSLILELTAVLPLSAVTRGISPRS